MYTFDSCGDLDSCAVQIQQSYPSFEYKTRTVIASGYYPVGLNKILLSSPIAIKKGNMLGVNHTSNTLAIETSDPSKLSDYFINDTTIFRINKVGLWRFYVKAIVDQNFYMNNELLSIYYENLNMEVYGSYQLTARFISANISLSRSYNVTNGKLVVSIT